MTDETLQSEKFPRRTQRRQQTRARIVSAADKLFRTVGYGAATMSAIAEEADVHVTTLFTHFKTKRDLAVSMNEQAAALLEQLVEQGKGTKPFFEFFLDLVLARAARVETARDPDSSLWRELSLDPELTFAWVQYEERQIQLLTDYLAFEYRLDAATDCRPELIATLMVSASRMTHRRWTESQGPMDLVAETRKAVELAIVMAKSVLARD